MSIKPKRKQVVLRIYWVHHPSATEGPLWIFQPQFGQLGQKEKNVSSHNINVFCKCHEIWVKTWNVTGDGQRDWQKDRQTRQMDRQTNRHGVFIQLLDEAKNSTKFELKYDNFFQRNAFRMMSAKASHYVETFIHEEWMTPILQDILSSRGTGKSARAQGIGTGTVKNGAVIGYANFATAQTQEDSLQD